MIQKSDSVPHEDYLSILNTLDSQLHYLSQQNKDECRKLIKNSGLMFNICIIY